MTIGSLPDKKANGILAEIRLELSRAKVGYSDPYMPRSFLHLSTRSRISGSTALAAHSIEPRWFRCAEAKLLQKQRAN